MHLALCALASSTKWCHVLVLLTHKQQIQHIHGHGLSPRPFCETKAPSSILILMGQKPISSWWICWSPFTFFHFIFLNNPDYELTTWSDEHLYTSLFRLPDLHPFMLFDSDMWVSQFCFTCWARKTNVPSTVSRVLVPSRTSHYLFNQLYIFVGSHFMSFSLPGYFDSKFSNSDSISASLAYSVDNYKLHLERSHCSAMMMMDETTVYFRGATIPSPTHLPYDHLSPKPPNLEKKSGPGTIGVVVSSWSHWPLSSTTSKRQVDKYISI